MFDIMYIDSLNWVSRQGLLQGLGSDGHIECHLQMFHSPQFKPNSTTF